MGDVKSLFIHLINLVKFVGRRENGKRLRNEDIAAAMSISREYLSTLTGAGGKVLQEHIDKLRDAFPDIIKPEDLTNSNITSRQNPRDPKITSDPEKEGITYIPISAQAGYYRKIVDPMFKSSLQKLFIPGMPYRGESYRIWEVEGNSMEPTFKEGFNVLTEKVEGPWRKIKEYHAYVIVTEDELMLKRLAYSKSKKDHWVLISDNEDLYPQFLLPVNEVKELWLVKRKLDWEMSPPKRFEIKL